MNTQIYKIANGRFSIKINSQIQNAPSIEILKGSKILLKSVKTSPFIRAAYSIVNGLSKLYIDRLFSIFYLMSKFIFQNPDPQWEFSIVRNITIYISWSDNHIH